MPVFHGSTPKIEGRLAPIRFWMSANPLRSTHRRKTGRWRTISRTTSAFAAAIPISSPIRRPSSRRAESVAREPFDELERRFARQALVIVLVHLHHRRGAARSEAFDLVQRELAIRES